MMNDTDQKNMAGSEQSTKDSANVPSSDSPHRFLHAGVISASLLFFAVIFIAFPPQKKMDAELTQTEPPVAANPFHHLNLEARAVYAYDLATGEVLYEKNAEAQLPLASLTKLMSAVVIADGVDKTDSVEITSEALAIEGDSGFASGQRWRAGDLLDFTLVTSSNDGAHSLASAVGGILPFSSKMNARARELGLVQTFFINETGLDTSDNLSGSYGSARDVATLLAYTLTHKPHLLEATRYEKLAFTTLDGKEFTAENTNDAIAAVPGLIAGKTGYTDLAGGNLAIVFDTGLRHPIVAVILGSTIDGRFSDMVQLVDAIHQTFEEEQQL